MKVHHCDLCKKAFAKNGIPYFAIKIGLLIRAIIMPLKISRKNELFDNLNQIAKTSYIFDEDKQ